jgi:hypothetical protein
MTRSVITNGFELRLSEVREASSLCLLRVCVDAERGSKARTLRVTSEGKAGRFAYHREAELEPYD